MIVYRDMAYCARKDCACKDCVRHLCNLDRERLPDWMCYSVAEFQSCIRYRKEDGKDENL